MNKYFLIISFVHQLYTLKVDLVYNFLSNVGRKGLYLYHSKKLFVLICTFTFPVHLIAHFISKPSSMNVFSFTF